ncbi:A/G-specific adenine glycosylase [Rhodovulum sulfidophilum]|uniref:Adenine DNA glycosylase n=1 Tax=Rhodovulum visakhapatnamense TaxID=364297 RepID=A0ABS1RDU8_9RHOB|nr:A/G-specific adenine glycosylase [Rhodovulum visakhapatnamense]MBL3570149.1 A/G-specific adenine glycosylase [Rhodovulum visakhapatnamense]MBL3576946.1 A/G-specific adenine glycosylase [Rhodovulum visakhapatnamense]OLS42978.1 A/G-specific adenine glycosylase [Rhodovulum sulfidophilum]
MRDDELSAELLAWYDIHARELPWRVGPAARKAGERPDPYRVWLSEVMLQQTTVAAVKDYFHRFTTLWPDVGALAAAEDARVMGEWAGLGYYARARNLLKCARAVAADHGGRFPDSRAALLALPGIGPYTAAAIAAIAFDRPETVVDGNVERVMSRLFAVETPLPTAKPDLTALAARLTPPERPGDHAQAVMDLGATICTPRNPACGICPWRAPCLARAEGIAAALPRKLPKTPKPTRLGRAYLGRRTDGAWLLERRPETGLLGGMLGWPGSDWAETEPFSAPPAEADWRPLGAEVRHTFTHFHLRLDLWVVDLPVDCIPDRGQFLAPAAFRPSDLPTVMRKAFDLARPAFDPPGNARG